MNLSGTYSMRNPWRYEEELLTAEVDAFMQAVDDQLYKLIYAPLFHIRDVEAIGKYYVIRFCLAEFKESPFCLYWADTVERSDLYDFIKLSHGPEDPEAYFLVNSFAVANEWLNSNPIE